MASKSFLIKTSDTNKFYYSNHRTFHEGDSGLDLFIVEDVIIPPKKTVLVDLQIQCQNRSFNFCFWKWFTKGFYKYNSYFLMPRSSISKTPLFMQNSIGLIDSGYLGTLKAPFMNTSSEPFLLSSGERYVQLVNADLSPIKFKLVKEHRNTTRGSGGFGSTGR
jgi:dUTP pyrophosphatase